MDIRDQLKIVKDKLLNENYKQGERVDFNEIKTIGFLQNVSGANIDENQKREIINSVEDFLKNSGLILNIVNIYVEDGRMSLKSDTIKNPGFDSFKSIIIDTDNENPIIDIVSSQMQLSNDFISLTNNIKRAYGDNQYGRNKLINVTQSNAV